MKKKTKQSKAPEPVVFPKSIKWDKLRDEEIAEMLNCHANTVYKYRKNNHFARAPRKPGSGSVAKIKLTSINMKKSIQENADKHGCSYNWMCTLMKKRRKMEIANGEKTPSKGEFWG